MSVARARHERRTEERTQRNLLVSYTLCASDGQRSPIQMGRTMDISQSGLKLEIYDDVSPYSTVAVSVGVRNREIRVSGRVVYADANPNGSRWIGVSLSSKLDPVVMEL
jgi:hypothetical protein